MQEKQRLKARIWELLNLLSKKSNEESTKETIQELVTLGGKAIPTLITALSKDETASIRMHASQALKEIARKKPEEVIQAVPALIEVLEKEELVSAHYYLAHLIYNSEETLELIAKKSGFENHNDLIVAFRSGKKITILEK
ncbi:MAG: hypothetical protein GF308_06045 [Candidatus Heimdallarchaeota archaeon]|nr:hypothetical protein [Candidatus Heimdallarchaeota archaeon]